MKSKNILLEYCFSFLYVIERPDINNKVGTAELWYHLDP